MKKLAITIILTISFTLCCFAKEPKRHYYYEKDYQKVWCDRNCGTTEFILPDKARVDCVTETHAIEFDFAHKWAESIGQALYYAEVLQKEAGIVLIVENEEKDQRYIERIKTVAKKHNIKLWLMYPNEMPSKTKTN